MSRLTRLWIAAGALLSIAAISAMDAPKAHAWLKVCNGTSVTISYSHSEPSSSCGSGNCGFLMKGWWNIAPGACATVYGGSVSNMFFYGHAHGGAFVWGNSSFQWQVPNTAHSQCQWCNVACTSGSGGPCFPLRPHFELHPTTTNHTLTLTP